MGYRTEGAARNDLVHARCMQVSSHRGQAKDRLSAFSRTRPLRDELPPSESGEARAVAPQVLASLRPWERRGRAIPPTAFEECDVSCGPTSAANLSKMGV